MYVQFTSCVCGYAVAKINSKLKALGKFRNLSVNNMQRSFVNMIYFVFQTSIVCHPNQRTAELGNNERLLIRRHAMLIYLETRDKAYNLRLAFAQGWVTWWLKCKMLSIVIPKRTLVLLYFIITSSMLIALSRKRLKKRWNFLALALRQLCNLRQPFRNTSHMFF